MSDIERIKEIIRNIPDFPQPGIIFRDITPLLGDGELFARALDLMLEGYGKASVDAIAGVEARGFIFGAAAAAKLGLPFIPVRKPGKLPWKTFEESYDLEYGKNVVTIHQDACKAGQRILLVDDLLATGGTAAASMSLIRKCGATPIGCSFLVELDFLKGRTKLEGIPVRALLHF